MKKTALTIRDEVALRIFAGMVAHYGLEEDETPQQRCASVANAMKESYDLADAALPVIDAQ